MPMWVYTTPFCTRMSMEWDSSVRPQCGNGYSVHCVPNPGQVSCAYLVAKIIRAPLVSGLSSGFTSRFPLQIGC